MDFLFLHQNFPGQFAHLAPALARAGHRVVALTSRVDKPQDWRGVRIVPYRWQAPENQRTHPWMTTMNRAVHRGAICYQAAESLKARGFSPDVIIAHSGWGEALFLRDIWPEAKIGVFCEFFYRAEGADIGFDPEFAPPPEIGAHQRVAMKNLAMRMQLEMADAGITPTAWQAEGWPRALRDKITVIHDGIDTAAARPDPEARLTLDGIGSWTREDEVITFVNRNLEPYRGFHVLMRALPDLLRRRPRAQVILVGEDGVSYGTEPSGGGSWKDRMIAEIGPRMTSADWDRVHFPGRIPRDAFTSLLQVSRVHLYLTYPFVLSWSLLEAMSCGCAIAASGTDPVREVMAHGQEGLLFDFFDGAGLVDAVCTLAEDPEMRARLGQNARDRVVSGFDLRQVCLPAQFRWIESFTGRAVIPG